MVEPDATTWHDARKLAELLCEAFYVGGVDRTLKLFKPSCELVGEMSFTDAVTLAEDVILRAQKAARRTSK